VLATPHTGSARARATDAIVATLRSRAGRGPERARLSLLGSSIVVAELGLVLTTLDRTLVAAGRTELVESRWAALRSAIAQELAEAVGATLATECACTGWVMDPDADALLIVFRVGQPTLQA
jgi:hypothetical protein